MSEENNEGFSNLNPAQRKALEKTLTDLFRQGNLTPKIDSINPDNIAITTTEKIVIEKLIVEIFSGLSDNDSSIDIENMSFEEKLIALRGLLSNIKANFKNHHE